MDVRASPVDRQRVKAWADFWNFQLLADIFGEPAPTILGGIDRT